MEVSISDPGEPRHTMECCCAASPFYLNQGWQCPGAEAGGYPLVQNGKPTCPWCIVLSFIKLVVLGMW